jgi:predicted RNA-binding protein with PIN domain
MHILIDGYNLLKRNGFNGETDAHARTTFVSHLAQYAKKKDHNLVIVFDGGPYQWPDTERTKGIEVVFSGERMSADEYIKEYISEHPNKHLLLITSDRELNEWADEHGVYSLDVHAFAYFLYPSGQEYRQQNVVKMCISSNRELDTLMRHSVPPLEKYTISQQMSLEKLSKRKRAMMQILKKL